MGAQHSTKSLDRRDVTMINQMSQGMDTLRRSVESFPDGTKRFRMTLDSNERKLQDVLRRSRKGNTRKRALSLLRDLGELKQREEGGDAEAAGARDSSLDNGAIESNSIIVADVHKYDRDRLNDKNWQTLCDVRRKLERLRKTVYAPSTADGGTADVQKQIDEMRARLARLQLEPQGHHDACRQEYVDVMAKYERKLAEKRRTATVGEVAAGGKQQQKSPATKTRHSGEARAPSTSATSSRPATTRTSTRSSAAPVEVASETAKHCDAQDTIALIQGKVHSLQDECDKFSGTKDSEEYTRLSQSLMQLWDQLGKITDPKLQEHRDTIIGLISVTLKTLNRRCIDNLRGSLSKNKMLATVEMFQLQYGKIEAHLSASGGADLRESDKIFQILSRIQKGLYAILYKNDCNLVTARMMSSLTCKPTSIYISKEQLKETKFDKVFIADADETDDFEGRPVIQDAPHDRKSMPLPIRAPQTPITTSTTLSAPIPDKLVVTKTPPIFSADVQPVHGVPQLDDTIENLNYEVMALKYKVDAFHANDKKQYDELDERLIDMLIKIASVKGKCNPRQEQMRVAIMQLVQETCAKLKAKCCDSLEKRADDGHNGEAAEERRAEQIHAIQNIAEHLEIWRTSINESYTWSTDNVEFQVLANALQSALLQLDLIEPADDDVHHAKIQVMDDVREAIKRLEAQRFRSSMAGTEV